MRSVLRGLRPSKGSVHPQPSQQRKTHFSDLPLNVLEHISRGLEDRNAVSVRKLNKNSQVKTLEYISARKYDMLVRTLAKRNIFVSLDRDYDHMVVSEYICNVPTPFWRTIYFSEGLLVYDHNDHNLLYSARPKTELLDLSLEQLKYVSGKMDEWMISTTKHAGYGKYYLDRLKNYKSVSGYHEKGPYAITHLLSNKKGRYDLFREQESAKAKFKLINVHAIIRALIASYPDKTLQGRPLRGLKGVAPKTRISMPGPASARSPQVVQVPPQGQVVLD